MSGGNLWNGTHSKAKRDSDSGGAKCIGGRE